MGDDQTAAERFDEHSLRADIVKVWGEYGAHIDVFDHIFKLAKSAVVPVSERPDQRLLDAIGDPEELRNPYEYGLLDRLRRIADAVEAVLSDTQTDPERPTNSEELVEWMEANGWERLTTGPAGSYWQHPDRQNVAVPDDMTTESYEWDPVLHRLGFDVPCFTCEGTGVRPPDPWHSRGPSPVPAVPNTEHPGDQ